MIKKLITLILLTFCSNLFAYHCEDIDEKFSSIYEVSYSSSQEVHVKNKQNPDSFSKVIAVGDEFQGRKDRHHNIRYVLNSINVNEVIFDYVYRYDARSVGGSFSECSGVLTIEL